MMMIIGQRAKIQNDTYLKKPRFGTFQSIMDHFLCEIIARKNINL